MRSRLGAVGKQIGAHISVGLHTVFGSRSNNAFGILMYHRVTEVRPGVATPTWNVPPARFRKQMEGLLALGYRAVRTSVLPQLVLRQQQFHTSEFVIEGIKRGVPSIEVPITVDVGTRNR